jgi:hypothetical protein
MYVILDRPPIGQCDLCGTPFYGQRDTIAHLQTAQHRIATVAEIAARHRQRERLGFHSEIEVRRWQYGDGPHVPTKN